MQLRFYHFNKCAGTSVLHFLHNRIAETELLHVERLPHAASEYETFDKKVLHTTVGNQEIATPWRQASLAIFRDPLERAFSDYKMVTRWKHEITTPALRETHAVAVAGILPFFNSKWAIDLQHYNMMTRTLAGPAFVDWFREVSVTHASLANAPKDKLLLKALEVLNDLDVVLTTDDLSLIGDIATALAQDQLPLPFDQRLNSFGTSKQLAGITPEERRVIESFNELDQVVWKRAKEIAASRRSEEAVKTIAARNDTRILDFGRSLPAVNIWPREVNRSKSSAWTGNGGTSMFHFHKRSDTRKFFNFLASGVLSGEQFEKMRVLVNGHRIQWRHLDTPRGFLVTAEIEPRHIAKSDVIRIAIDAPVVPAPDANDPRLLGIEISGASLIADWEGLGQSSAMPVATTASFLKRLVGRD